MKKIFRKKLGGGSGFTLIELLVVISVIGVLSLIIVPNLLGARERARDTKKKADLNQLRSAMRLYYNDAQSYPDTITSGSSLTNEAGTEVYMSEVPEFNASGYDVSTDGDYYVFVVTLENSSDQDIAASQSRCDYSLDQAGISVTVTAETDFVVCNE